MDQFGDINLGILPSELRLNLLKYGANQYESGLSDEEIVKEILEYEPTFDIDVWRDQIHIKKKFIEKVDKSLLIPIYKYIKNGGYELQFIGRDNDISFTGDNPTVIVDTLKKAGYRVNEVSSGEEVNGMGIPNVYRYFINTPDIESIRLELSWIWQRLEPRNPHISFSDAAANSHSELVSISRVQHIPLTLSGYLRYVIKNFHSNRKFKGYALYSLIEDIVWEYLIGKKNSELTLGIYIPERLFKQIGTELTSIFGPGKVHLANDWEYAFKINSTEDIGLYAIDQHFHPYIPIDPSILV